jgi:hypothetical protein
MTERSGASAHVRAAFPLSKRQQLKIQIMVPVVAGTRAVWRRFVFPGPQPQSVPALVQAALPETALEAGGPNLSA